MEPKTYVKKPLFVRAFQWDGTEAGADALIKAFPKAPIRVLESCPIQVQISTLEGMMLVSPGDFVIEGVKGEYYPCKPDIFEQTYSVVSGSGGGPAKELLPPGIIPEPKSDAPTIGIDKASDGPEAEIRDTLVFGGKVYSDLALPAGMTPTVALIADLPAKTDRMFLNETWLSGRERKGMIRVVACAPLGQSAPYILPLPLSEPDMADLEATLCDGEPCTARLVVGWMSQADYDELSEFDGW